MRRIVAWDTTIKFFFFPGGYTEKMGMLSGRRVIHRFSRREYRKVKDGY
jgi:hypothetical protein